MFIEVDVVEFADKEIPYTTVMVNLKYIMQLQPIGKKQRDQYAAAREAARHNQLTDPNVRVSPVEDLPNSGAVMYMMGGTQAPIYYTVTPYTEIRDTILKLQSTEEA